MIRDTLFLLEPDFNDPAFPGERFYCWQCALMEGVLKMFAEQLADLEVRRVAWPRPRKALQDRVGNPDQSLPLLVLGDGRASGLATGTHGEVFFVEGKDEILNALSVRYGIPKAHP